MFCPKCGVELDPTVGFCRFCGTNVSHLTGVDIGDFQMSDPSQQTYTADGTSSAPAAEATAGMPRSTIVLLAAIVVAALVFVFVIASQGGGTGLGGNAGTANVGARVAETPTVTAANGSAVKAISRPTFYDLIPGETELGVSPSIQPYTIEPGLSNVINVSDMGLTDQEKSLIEKNGFSVSVGATGDEFFMRYELNRYGKLPNYVTVDSMMHTYHLYFAYLLKNTEKTSLSGDIVLLSEQMLEESKNQLSQLEGTEWEDAARRNVAFFAVGATLMGSAVDVPSSVSDVVAKEVSNVQSASGIADSPLLGATEDYSQYAPRGYYAGDEALERYFRTMMWYGRMNFKQSDEDLDRSALLMVMAMKGDALGLWEAAYAVTSFFAGASDDCGYYEYFPLVQAAYGDNATVADLPGNAQAWQDYHAMTASMSAPKINSVVVWQGEDENVLQDEKGFRLMGQRFSLDAAIFQQLMYSSVGDNSQGEKRMLPNALDVPAALGSDEALSILDSKGETGYAGYTQKMQELRSSISDDDASLWNASLYSQWLHTLNPLLEPKGEGYPMFMQTVEWTRKNLQTYLGSYTELKHDTVLYTKQAMAELGGGNIDRDDRGFVECEPEVFTRLARLTQATMAGLKEYEMLTPEDADNLARLQELAERLATIASKELAGELPDDAEFELIRSFGGQIEHFWTEVYKPTNTSMARAKEFPASLVTDVATDPNGSVLELGTGNVSTIKVVVPVDGKLRIASGAVYSFYQFEQPLSNRLTDEEWRNMIGTVPIEDWTTGFQYQDTRYSW